MKAIVSTALSLIFLVGFTSALGTCGKLIPLALPELVEYAHVEDNEISKWTVADLGEAKFEDANGGILVTCQCKAKKGKNHWCALEFDNAIDSFKSQNSTAINLNVEADGHFDLISSAKTKITCGGNGLFVVNGTTATHYTCYSGSYKNNCVVNETGNLPASCSA